MYRGGVEKRYGGERCMCCGRKRYCFNFIQLTFQITLLGIYICASNEHDMNLFRVGVIEGRCFVLADSEGV